MAAMSQMTTFNSLPPELILRIFENCPDLSAAKNLGSTYRGTYAVWRAFLKSICEHVLSRTIRCYDDAKAVTTALEKVQWPPQSTNEAHVRRLILVAKSAKFGCDLMQSHLAYTQTRHGVMDNNEQRRFLHIFYTVWTFAILFHADLLYTYRPESSPYSHERFLQACSDHDCYIISAISSALREIGTETGYRGYRLLPGQDEMIEALKQDLSEEGRCRLALMKSPEELLRLDETVDKWHDAMASLQRQIHTKFSGEGGELQKLPGSDTGVRVLLDTYQHTLVRRD
ncbi:MAG: hypothetical protein Q9168_007909 [Polycauliona sp. 1 TL-2023]